MSADPAPPLRPRPPEFTDTVHVTTGLAATGAAADPATGPAVPEPAATGAGPAGLPAAGPATDPFSTRPAGPALPRRPLPEHVGPYRIVRVLGEGGMGVAYEAEQTAPIRRRVALKVVRAEAASREVLARFEAERQALAVMAHAAIARVLDAGASAAGEPYFVMELVPRAPITDYCDAHRLTVRERLALFATVCRAVQHAHQKGVIHRDLKPSNALVADEDGRPLPKVIDFGIAEAVTRPLTEQTLVTVYGQAIGTPAYMSPEQADGSGLDVDTRADVYSLGVMLYELLVGRLPADPRELGVLGFLAQLVARRRPAHAERAVRGAGRRPGGGRRGGGAPPRRPRRAAPAAARGPRLDRDARARRRPRPPLRDGQRARPRPRALPRRPAGGGAPAVGAVPRAQVRAAAPRGRGRRGARRAGSGRRRGGGGGRPRPRHARRGAGARRGGRGGAGVGLPRRAVPRVRPGAGARHHAHRARCSTRAPAGSRPSSPGGRWCRRASRTRWATCTPRSGSTPRRNGCSAARSRRARASAARRRRRWATT